MFTAIVALLSGGFGGGLLSLATGLLKVWDKKNEMAHEREMLKSQLELDKQRAADQLAMTQAQGSIVVDEKGMDAFIEAIKGQGQLTGNKWIDGINQLVRPLITYWWMLLFTVYKVGTLVMLYHGSATAADFFSHMWGDRDWEIFGTIIGFWFVNRTLFHNHK